MTGTKEIMKKKILKRNWVRWAILRQGFMTTKCFNKELLSFIILVLNETMNIRVVTNRTFGDFATIFIPINFSVVKLCVIILF